MAVAIGHVSVKKPRRGRSSTRLTRKVAIFGCHAASLTDAPWDDLSWEFYGHASGRAWYEKEMDYYIDLHPPACWKRGGRKTALYPKWLARNTVPIYMQKHYPEVPASIEYPKGRILSEFGSQRPYFTNQAAWLIALALTEGVTHIGLWGVNYGIESEYQIQRGCAEAWLYYAKAKGVQIVLPEQCTLLRDPVGLYGYESHDEKTGHRVPEYTAKKWKPQEDIRPVVPGQPGAERATPTADIRAEIELEEAENIRPDWSLGPLGGNGGIQKENHG